MTTDEGFLQAIFNDPEDDALRLVYADWLEEHDQPERAEFIRVQVELARLEEIDPRRADLQRRERVLIRRHRRAWLGDLPTGVRFFRFQRGFAEVKVYAKAVNYLKKAARWDAQTPPLHRFRLQLFDAQDHLTVVLATPLMTRLAELNLYGSRIGDEGARHLAATPALGRLSALGLFSNGVGRAGAEALLGSPWLAQLTALDLGFNPLGDGGVTVLVGGPSLTRLVELGLFSAGVGDAGALALAGSSHLPRLAHLDLTMNAIGEAGRKALRERFGDRVRLEQQNEQC